MCYIYVCIYIYIYHVPDTLVESIEQRPQMLEFGLSIRCRVKPVTYNVDTCHFLAWHSALIGYGKDWFAECQDKLTEWDHGSWCWQPDFPVAQHCKVIVCANCHKSVLILI